MDSATTGSASFDTDCVPCTNTAGDASYGYCPGYGETGPTAFTSTSSGSTAVDDGYKADEYLDSATPYYDSRVKDNDHIRDVHPLYVHYYMVDKSTGGGAAVTTLEGKVVTAT